MKADFKKKTKSKKNKNNLQEALKLLNLKGVIDSDDSDSEVNMYTNVYEKG